MPLWSHQATRRLPPASLTKLMTALLLTDENSSQATTIITISPRARRATGSRLGVYAGERFHFDDLLAATLLASANDACLALAEHVAGTEAQFVARMNQRADELGLKDTHYSNACGHDAVDHYSSAADLARLAALTLERPQITRIVARSHQNITTLDGKRRYTLTNKNLLIGRYPGALGLKTGYTPTAGKCLVAYAQRRQQRVLLVLLNAPNRWWDATDILDLAFTQMAK
ncbi:MAG: D-alanyl-D-alanine carboxypeptidase [Sterolibacterium sp.]|nr:D-alanyl-D-alanine carboxypeptidase [Sterolibacterium sp.]MBP9799798.1 D-alanyl-D-alanine carboxypeptidase [Sterolibacterium sp.]